MSIIKSGNTETTGLVYQSDTTGNLVFETLGTAAVTISTTQNVAMAGNLAVAGLYTNTANISANLTIAESTNAMKIGPITVNSNVVLTVSAGATLVVI